MLSPNNSPVTPSPTFDSHTLTVPSMPEYLTITNPDAQQIAAQLGYFVANMMKQTNDYIRQTQREADKRIKTVEQATKEVIEEATKREEQHVQLVGTLSTNLETYKAESRELTSQLTNIRQQFDAIQKENSRLASRAQAQQSEISRLRVAKITGPDPATNVTKRDAFFPPPVTKKGSMVVTTSLAYAEKLRTFMASKKQLPPLSPTKKLSHPRRQIEISACLVEPTGLFLICQLNNNDKYTLYLPSLSMNSPNLTFHIAALIQLYLVSQIAHLKKMLEEHINVVVTPDQKGTLSIEDYPSKYTSTVYSM